MEWFMARFGNFTASNIGKLMVNGRGGGFGKGAETYIKKVAKERALKPFITEESVMDDYIFYTQAKPTPAMQRGIDAEPITRNLYSLRTGNPVVEVGSVMHNMVRGFSGSPDGLVGEDGIIEMKDVGDDTYAEYILEVKDAASLKAVNADYYWQCIANTIKKSVLYFNLMGSCRNFHSWKTWHLRHHDPANGTHPVWCA